MIIVQTLTLPGGKCAISARRPSPPGWGQAVAGAGAVTAGVGAGAGAGAAAGPSPGIGNVNHVLILTLRGEKSVTNVRSRSLKAVV